MKNNYFLLSLSLIFTIVYPAQKPQGESQVDYAKEQIQALINELPQSDLKKRLLFAHHQSRIEDVIFQLKEAVRIYGKQIYHQEDKALLAPNGKKIIVAEFANDRIQNLIKRINEFGQPAAPAPKPQPQPGTQEAALKKQADEEARRREEARLKQEQQRKEQTEAQRKKREQEARQKAEAERLKKAQAEQAERQRKAEQEARQKAEAERQRKEAEEAQKKAVEEQQRKAAEQAKQKAEAERQQKAQAEQAERQRKAEQDERQKAEAERQRQQEEELRQRVAAERQRQQAEQAERQKKEQAERQAKAGQEAGQAQPPLTEDMRLIQEINKKYPAFFAHIPQEVQVKMIEELKKAFGIIF